MQSYIGEHAATRNGELAFVALLGFLHGGALVSAVAASGWCCWQCIGGSKMPNSEPLASGTASQSVPALAAADGQTGGREISGRPAAPSRPEDAEAMSEEARLLTLSITYLRELATSILMMDERIDEGTAPLRGCCCLCLRANALFRQSQIGLLTDACLPRTAVNTAMERQQELLEQALSAQRRRRRRDTFRLSSAAGVEHTIPSAASVSPSLRHVPRASRLSSGGDQQAMDVSFSSGSSSSSDE